MLATSTVLRSPPKPGWQTDELEEEWIEPSSHNHDDYDIHGTPTHTRSFTFSNHSQDLAHRSPAVPRLTAPPSPTPQGTFLIREDQPAAPILPKPLGKGKGKGKGLIKDFFSPLALETMFDPPSPRIIHENLPAVPSRLSQFHVVENNEKPGLEQLLDDSEGARDEGLGEGDMEEETRPLSSGGWKGGEGSGGDEDDGDKDVILASDIPNLVSFDGRKPSSAYKFTFSQPRPTGIPALVPESTASPSPIQAKEARQSQPQAPATDPRLRLFQFHYDTFTREHLSAMVDSIAVHTPSSGSGGSGSPAGPLTNIQSYHQPLSTPEPSADAGYLRATKRLKLTPPEERSENDISIRAKSRKDYVGESRNLMWKIKQTRTPSMMTTVSQKENMQPTNVEDHSTVEDRPRRRPLGEVRSMWSSDTPSDSSDLNQSQSPSSSRQPSAAYTSSSLHPVYPTSTLTPSIPSSLFSSTSNSNSKPSTIASALGYRRQAADLMAQIRKDMTTGKRLVSLETLKDYDVSGAPLHVHVTPASPGRLQREVLQPKSSRTPSPRPRLALSPHTDEKDKDKSPLPRKVPKPSPRKLLRRLSAADEVDRELAMEKSVSDVSKDVEADAQPDNQPLDPKHFPESSPEPIPPLHSARHPQVQTIQVFRMSAPVPLLPDPRFLVPADPNRIVSIGTTSSVETAESVLTRGTSATSATSVITGRTASMGSVASAASFVKHPGPVQMTRIGPEDVPSLPEMVGGMRFDRALMRWVKAGPMKLPDGAGSDEPGAPALEESDDPFRSFESLDSGHVDVLSAAEETAHANADAERMQEPAGGVLTTSRTVMQVDDTDDSFDFEDGSGAAIVEIMTGVDSRGTGSETETTDSEEDEVALGPQGSESDDTSEEEDAHGEGDEDLTATAPVRHVALPASVERAAMPASYSTPVPAHRNGIPPPRSALKNGSTSLNHKISLSAVRTPNNLFSSAHRRSVSFSDGRKDGKIKGLGRGEEVETSIEGPSPVIPMGGSSFVPSVRGNRIAAILEDLAEPSFEEQTPSKASTSSRPPMGTIQPLSSRSQSQSVISSSRRTFSRSTKEKELSLAHGNQTFLTECSFGVAHDKLVQVITDVHPYVPHWESLAQIDLSKKGVESVARLKEFLPKLDALNLDANTVSWLTGVPKTVRSLSITSNLLTSLASFSHVKNLENLDISSNQIDSLQQLACLRHLRELKADGNAIASLDGLGELDGLTKVSLKGNRISHVDMEQLHWPRIELLNLSRNGLRSVTGLASLSSLTALNLDHNRLENLDADRAMTRLRTLRVSDNRLVRLDASHFTNLRTLYADNNRLCDLRGVQRLRKLENLSLRNQGGRGLTLATKDIRDVTRLYLSGNPLSSSFIEEPCFNLIYLELAACRLTELPPDLARLIPNVRVLNLNYNFLTDARGLDGLTRLRKLTLIGSQLKGTKALVRVLRRMPEIEMLDFRMNPCTLGWYLPILVQDVPGALQPSEDARPGPAATDADLEPGIRAGAGGGDATAHSHPRSWQELDAKFRRDLPDEAYVGRLAYRGLVMRACPRVRMLDGVVVEKREREKAERLLQGVLGAKGDDRGVRGCGARRAKV